MVRVLLGDSDPLSAQSVTDLLGDETNVAVIGRESAALALTRAAERLSPSVLVVDVAQRQFSGAGLLAQWIAACPHVVVLTTDPTPAQALEFLRAGVRGVIDKADASLLANPPVVTAQTVPPVAVPPGGALTRQEHAVLAAVAAGRTSHETAQQLGVSVGTLQGHMHQVIAKLKVKDRTQAVAWAYLSGLCNVPGHPRIPQQRNAP